MDKISDLRFIGRWSIDGSLCDSIIEDFEQKKSLQEEAHSTRGYKVIPSSSMDSELMTEYSNEINRVMMEYKKIYEFSHKTIEAFHISQPWNIQKYEVGKYYSNWHCENNGDPKFRGRHLAFMTYLNTVTDGGETEFLYQREKIKPERGLTLIWPAHFTHTHIGRPSLTQIKYVTTGWFEFFDTEQFLEANKDTSDLDFWKSLEKMHSEVT